MQKKQKPALVNIQMLVMDVDGVLTDGTITIDSNGREAKRFNLLDGHGIVLWHRAGLKTAIISGRTAQATEIRAQELGINYVFQGCKQKNETFEGLLAKTGLSPEQMAYIGDDIVDLPILNRVGFSVAVENAVEEVKHAADYITSRPGGCGAVREVIEYILKRTGKWQKIMQRYLS